MAFSCTAPPQRTTTPTRSDGILLQKVLKLPEAPTDVRWREETRGDGFMGPQDRELSALLRYAQSPGFLPLSPSNPTTPETLTFPASTWSHQALVDWGLAQPDQDMLVVATPLPPDAWRPSSFTTVGVWWIPALRVVYLQGCTS